MNEYELIIQFESETPYYEIGSFIINNLLDKFDNLQMWGLKRKNGMVEENNAVIEKIECWEDCEYANPKSEIISAYLMKKKEIKKIRKKLLDILVGYEIGNYNNNINQFYKNVCDIYKELEEITE